MQRAEQSFGEMGGGPEGTSPRGLLGLARARCTAGGSQAGEAELARRGRRCARPVCPQQAASAPGGPAGVAGEPGGSRLVGRELVEVEQEAQTQ